RQKLDVSLQTASGVWDLVRTVHPYTLKALREWTQLKFVARAVTHESAYYWLFARRLLGLLPPGGMPVILVDRHTDAENLDVRGNSPIGLPSSGVTDANWAEMLVQDGLAPLVLRVNFDQEGVPKVVSIVKRNDNGKVVLENLQDNTLNPLLFKHQPLLTIDLDTFSSNGGPKGEAPFHYGLEEVRQRMENLVVVLKAAWLQPVGWLTVDSPGYLSPEADEKYRNEVQDVIMKVGEGYHEKFPAAEPAESGSSILMPRPTPRPPPPQKGISLFEVALGLVAIVGLVAVARPLLFHMHALAVAA